MAWVDRDCKVWSDNRTDMRFGREWGGVLEDVASLLRSSLITDVTKVTAMVEDDLCNDNKTYNEIYRLIKHVLL